MKKHLSRALAWLLTLAMVLTLLPAMSFATEVGDRATLYEGMPEDGMTGVIYACSGGYSKVMGYDIVDGQAAAKAVSVVDDTMTLPDGTAAIKFIKNTDGTYYFMYGSKYLVIKDTTAGTEKLVLCDTAETGAKWSIIADKAGMDGAYNIMNAEYKYGSYKSDVYLECYQGKNFCGYSYKTANPEYFQFQFYSCNPDDDGRVGEVKEAAALPVAGDKVVIYNDYAKACFGQPDPDAAKECLKAASATLKGGTLAYSDIGNGTLIFDVTKDGDSYLFQTGGKYLAMPENYVNDEGKTVNDETLILIDTASEYAKWSLETINGGYCMYNKAATWKGFRVCLEYFNDVFSGYSYDSSNPDIFAMNFYKVQDKYNCGYVVNPSVKFEDAKAEVGTDCQIKFEVDDLSGITSTTATYWFDDASASAKTAAVTYENMIGSFTIPSSELAGHTSLSVKVVVKDAMNIEFSNTLKLDVSDEPLITAVFPAPNEATGDETKPEIYATFVNAGTNPAVTMTLDGKAVTPTVKDGKASYTPTAALSQDKHTATVSITRADGKKVEKTWSFFVGEKGLSLYFGQIHSHTAEYSDGAGTLEDAYEHAYGADDVDFLIVTDHSNYFDTTKTATTSSYYDLSSLTKNSEGTMTKWEEARRTAAEYNAKYDDFICAYGYEMTWSGGPGHTNTFNTYGTVSRNQSNLNNKANYAGMYLYNDLMVNANKGLDVNGDPVAEGVKTKYLEDAPVVSQFNHPGTTFGTFGDFIGCTATRDSVLNLVEVGNGEGAVGGSAYWPSIEEYDKALAMGWHVAPTNNQDNHKGNWGDSNSCRDVILTDDFTEAGLYKAMAARHVYSTEDQNLQMIYYLNVNGTDYLQGDIANADSANKPEKVTVKCSLYDPDGEALGTVQVIGENGKVLAQQAISGGSYEYTATIPNDNAYYYIKVIQKDGQIAVSAPVWTSESVPVNVSVDTDSAVALVGEEETITVSLLNGSETDAISLVKYTVQVDNVSIASENLNEDLAAGATKTVEVKYTPKTAGEHKIVAYFRFTYKGQTYTFNASMTEKTLLAEDAIFVGIDSGHTNFYVSGDYAGCETSFIQICADNGIICKYIEAGEMTKENLAKFDMIVLNVPFVRSTTIKPTVWTDEELAAIADYASKGGNIINLCRADREDYDQGEFSSASISNTVQEAIGANTRFVQGIVVDTDRMSGGTSYRVYFDGAELVNQDHPFTAGIVESSNGQYQFYNGTAITVNEGAEDKVTTLIKGYDTTWVANYTDNFTGAAYVPSYKVDTTLVEKGKVNLITTETLSGGGFLVCGGASFVTTYDLSTDDAASEQYENYSMVLNILDYLKTGGKTPKITKIADIHKGTAGAEYTAEGWVTSNASGYDQNTAFFDCIYVQDETRGINVFPVAGKYRIGQKVRVHGALTSYCGEVELNLSPDYNGYIKIISDELNVIEPKTMSCKAAMADSNIGNLTKITGLITKIHKTAGVVDYIYVDDGSGTEGCLFINGYIGSEDTHMNDFEVGMCVTGVGIGSRDVDETSTSQAIIRRLRVRDRSEVIAYWDPCDDFTDINRSAWYHSAVDFVVENKLMLGVGGSKFDPNGTVDRAMVVALMYRICGATDTDYTGKFSDVAKNAWYAEEVEWAAKNGLALGDGKGKFLPEQKVTREDTAVFLYRLAEFMGYDVSARGSLDGFADKSKVSDYAVDALEWAVDYGILKGDLTNGVLNIYPKNGAQRCEFAAMIQRFLENLDQMDNKDDLVVLYTNDVHCGVDYSVTSFGYAGLAQIKKDLEANHEQVLLVDCGDAIQGEAIGTLSKGAYLVDLMNELGYDYAVLGNHEFDYGMEELKARLDEADAQYLACNFKYTGNDKDNAIDLESYAITEYGDKKVAFVGISTPETLVKSTPTYFQDEDGNWIYDFCNDLTGEDLYNAVQAAVDAAKAAGADYVVALSHLGTDEASSPWRSTDVIRNTTGIDVVLDGHSHSVIAQQIEKNKDGKDVLLSSTGTKLANVGKLTITADGKLRTELLARTDYNAYDVKDDKDNIIDGYWDDETKAFLDGIEEQYAALLNEVVAHTDYDLLVSNPETGLRAVRYQETNLGDVCADAYREVLGADIAFVNGGGVRASIKAGDVTYGNIIAVHPFGNAACMVEATGQEIVDALEMSSRAVSVDEDGNPINELGGFLQVSGLKYTINTAVESTVKTDTAGMFDSVTGVRRVSDVKVLNKTTGEYEPIDLTKTYTLASHNYMLKSGGDGLGMFRDNTILLDEVKLDNQVLIEYMTSEAFKSHDYSKWDGEGRITLNSGAYVPPVDGDEYVLKSFSEIEAGDKVILYNPGYAKAVKNETDNDWYLIAQDVTPNDGTIVNKDDTIVWTVAKNEDGTYSFTNGTNAITAWLSGTYVELTNNASYTGGDSTWNVTACNETNKTYYIYSKSIATSYGPGYLECYTKKDGVKVCGYAASASKLNENDYGFQFYVYAG